MRRLPGSFRPCVLLLLATLLSWAATLGVEPTAGSQEVHKDTPRLPESRKVTLKLDQVPAPQAVRELWRATELPLACLQNFREGDTLDPERRMTLEMTEVPYFEALKRFCDAYGEMSFDCHGYRVVLFPYRVWEPQQWVDGVLAYTLRSVEEEKFTDFQHSRSDCRIEFHVGWQPDVRVLGGGSLVISRAIDDRGRDVLQGKPVATEGGFKDNPGGSWQGMQFKVTLPMASKNAKTLTLAGSMELELPQRTVPLKIPLAELPQFAKSGGFVLESRVTRSADLHVATLRVKPETGKLSTEEIVDACLWKSGDPLELAFPWAWVRPKSVTACLDGSVELQVEVGKESVEAIGCRVVQGRHRLRVPFELKDLELGR